MLDKLIIIIYNIYMKEKLYTIKELEKIFQVTRQAITLWIKSGKLKAHKIGGKFWRIKESDLHRFIDNSYIKK